MCAAWALRGSPASTTTTDRRDRASCSAAASPAPPPPTTTTSHLREVSMGRGYGSDAEWARVLAVLARQVHAHPMGNELLDLDGLVRTRLRSLRESMGWSLDLLGERSQLSPSTI